MELGPGYELRLSALMKDYAPEWEFEIGPALIATRRQGSSVRVLAAHDPDVLREKIESARMSAPPRDVRPG